MLPMHTYLAMVINTFSSVSVYTHTGMETPDESEMGEAAYDGPRTPHCQPPGPQYTPSDGATNGMSIPCNDSSANKCLINI